MLISIMMKILLKAKQENKYLQHFTFLVMIELSIQDQLKRYSTL
jgi:hypothetical protein